MTRFPLTRRLCALLLVVLPWAATGCNDPSRTISLNAYRNAVATGAADVLVTHGVALRDRPVCRTPGAKDAAAGEGFAVQCTARTERDEPVTVTGHVRAAGTPRQAERYEITVAGRVITTTTCLGSGCPG